MDNPQEDKKKKKQQLKKLVVFLNNFAGLVAVVLAILIIAGGIFYLVLPKYQAISKELKSSVESKQSEIDALNSYMVKLNKYVKTYSRIDESDKEKLGRLLPEKKYDKEELFAYMERFINDRGLFLESVSLAVQDDKKRNRRRSVSSDDEGQKPLPPQVQKVEMDMSIIGLDYRGLKKLLREFERNLRLMDVKGIGFKPGEKKATLKVVTYYLKTPSPQAEE